MSFAILLSIPSGIGAFHASRHWRFPCPLRDGYSQTLPTVAIFRCPGIRRVRSACRERMNLAVVRRSRIVFGMADAVSALAQAAAARATPGGMEGGAVTLLSAPGAALYAGCGWWRAV